MIAWTVFENLPGSPQTNFEKLCRSLIWINYSRYGSFAGLANQPGVEFHLHLSAECSLAKAGKWFGWQCKWYALDSGVSIGQTRRKQIIDSLEKSSEAVPGLTDWVLVTKHTLTKGDQTWFRSIDTKLTLHMWSASELENLFIGEAEILRQTYFGNLVLTPDILNRQHQLSIQPISKRWLPEVHQIVDAEKTLRKMLGESAAWDELIQLNQSLMNSIDILKKDLIATSGNLKEYTEKFCSAARQMADSLFNTFEFIKNNELGLLRSLLNNRICNIDPIVRKMPMLLRGCRLRSGLIATNALDDLRNAIEMQSDISRFLGLGVVGLIAEAGGGKTQIGAQISAATLYRPAGIFMRGQEFKVGMTLDDLARRINVNGQSVGSMESLIAALNSAGDRANCRLPIVIDGLNEAEDPREWKAPLATLDKLLENYANVLVVCTLRTGSRKSSDSDEYYRHVEDNPETRNTFVSMALPDHIEKVEIEGFGENTTEAIDRYFLFYGINRAEMKLPLELLQHPLTLRIFCEVANPERKKEVTLEASPGSLSSMFERYIESATERISELSSQRNRYYAHDVRKAIDHFGNMLGRLNNRTVNEDEFRKEIGDNTRQWDDSIVHRLEQEGIILRIPGKSPDSLDIIPVYDALGGFIVANTIIKRDGFESWLKDEDGINFFFGPYNERHPLGSDILSALVSLVPAKRYGRQLWQIVDSQFSSFILELSVNLEARYIDLATVDALLKMIIDKQSSRIFPKLLQMRSSPNHPLNSNFLHLALCEMEISDRDLHWTEWIRNSLPGLNDDVENWIKLWQQDVTNRTESDRLRAKWIIWLLTSTSHQLRQNATYALYWFGRGAPIVLFDLLLDVARINDPYVLERFMSACYGVTMVIKSDPTMAQHKKHLPRFAEELFDLFFNRNTCQKRIHYTTREYAYRILQISKNYHKTYFTQDRLQLMKPPFGTLKGILWEGIKKSESDVRGAMHMDFENYTLGRLIKDRSAYDFNHPLYAQARKQILQRIDELGWSEKKFKEIDRDISNLRTNYARTGLERFKVDRYGKKYSWIAYFELSAWLRDNGLFGSSEGRDWDLDIDPSFPLPGKTFRIINRDLYDGWSGSAIEWMEHGLVPSLEADLVQKQLFGIDGPWVVIDGYLSQQKRKEGLGVFAFVSSFFVQNKDVSEVIAGVKKQQLNRDYLNSNRTISNIFSGELPWCDELPPTESSEMQFVIGSTMKKVVEKKHRFFLDGKEIDSSLVAFIALRKRIPNISTLIPLTGDEIARITTSEEIVESTEVEDVVKIVTVYSPVEDGNIVGRPIVDASKNIKFLSKKFANAVNLINVPQTFDFQTKKSERATIGTSYNLNSYEDSEHFLFIKKDVLTKILSKLEMSMITIIHGERELRFEKFGFYKNDIDFEKCKFQYVAGVINPHGEIDI